MTIAQCKAARRRWRNDGRYKPKKGSRGNAKMSKSAMRAMAKMRKRVQKGGLMGSVGFEV